METNEALAALDAERDAYWTAAFEREALMDADLDALIAELDEEEDVADTIAEYDARQTLWSAASGPADLWNTSTLTEWEM